MKKWLFFLPLALCAEDLIPVMAPQYDKLKAHMDFCYAKRIPQALENAIRSLSCETRWHDYLAGYSSPEFHEHELETHLTAHKLKVKEQHTEPKEQLFSSKSHFVFFLKQWLPHLSQLPEELQGEFLSELVGHYLEIFPPDREGNIHFLVESVVISLY